MSPRIYWKWLKQKVLAKTVVTAKQVVDKGSFYKGITLGATKTVKNFKKQTFPWCFGEILIDWFLKVEGLKYVMDWGGKFGHKFIAGIQSQQYPVGFPRPPHKCDVLNRECLMQLPQNFLNLQLTQLTRQN